MMTRPINSLLFIALIQSLVFNIAIADEDLARVADLIGSGYQIQVVHENPSCNIPPQEYYATNNASTFFDDFFAGKSRFDMRYCTKSDRYVEISPEYLDWRTRRELRKADLENILLSELALSSETTPDSPIAALTSGISLDFTRMGMLAEFNSPDPLHLKVALCSPKDFNVLNIRKKFSDALASVRSALKSQKRNKKGVPRGYFDHVERLVYLSPDHSWRLYSESKEYNVFFTQGVEGLNDQYATISVLDKCVLKSLRRKPTNKQLANAIASKEYDLIRGQTLPNIGTSEHKRLKTSREAFKRDMNQRVQQIQTKRILDNARKK